MHETASTHTHTHTYIRPPAHTHTYIRPLAHTHTYIHTLDLQHTHTHTLDLQHSFLKRRTNKAWTRSQSRPGYRSGAFSLESAGAGDCVPNPRPVCPHSLEPLPELQRAKNTQAAISIFPFACSSSGHRMWWWRWWVWLLM